MPVNVPIFGGGTVIPLQGVRPTSPNWGPVDVSQQLQQGIGSLYKLYASSEHDAYSTAKQRQAGDEWNQGVSAASLAQPGGIYGPPATAAPGAPGATGAPGASGGYNVAGARPSFVPGGGDASTEGLLRRFESFSDKPYFDKTAWRVGYGSDTITDPQTGAVRRVQPGDRITRDMAEADLSRRIPEFQRTIMSQTPIFATLSEPTKAALTSVAYNYGRLPNSVVAAVNTGDPHQIANAVAELPANQSRRAVEASVIRSGGGPGAPQAATGAPQYDARGRQMTYEEQAAQAQGQGMSAPAMPRAPTGPVSQNDQPLFAPQPVAPVRVAGAPVTGGGSQVAPDAPGTMPPEPEVITQAKAIAADPTVPMEVRAGAARTVRQYLETHQPAPVQTAPPPPPPPPGAQGTLPPQQAAPAPQVAPVGSLDQAGIRPLGSTVPGGLGAPGGPPGASQATLAPPAAVPPPPPPPAPAPAPGAPQATLAPGQQAPVPQAAGTAQIANRLGINPEALQAANPHMLRALGLAIQAGDPAMVSAIASGINSVTASTTAKQQNAQTVSDTVYERDPTGRWMPVIKSGAANQPGTIVVRPEDKANRARFNLPDDGRAYTVKFDSKTGQPEAIAPITEPETKSPEVKEGYQWNPQTQRYDIPVGPPGGDKPMFDTKSVEGQALNYMVQTGTLTKDQAADLATGKTVTGADGRQYFFRGSELIGVPADGSPGVPVVPPAPPGTVPSPGSAGAPGATGGRVLTPEKAVTVPAEVNSRLALASNYLNEYDPLIREAITGGTLTSPMGRVELAGGIGKAGEIYRRMDEGSDGLVRMLTGAGMPAEEAARYRTRYMPSSIDSKETMLSKAKQLSDILKVVTASVAKGRPLTPDELESIRASDTGFGRSVLGEHTSTKGQPFREVP
jgi:GH24 family phage-related lysozyme (muramidase)